MTSCPDSVRTRFWQDDDEAKKNDMLKAFTQKVAPWYKIAYW
jgi:hypothetical protein